MICNADDLTFCVIAVDRFFHSEGVFEVEARPYAAISFRLCGEGKFEIDGKTLYSKPGDILFLPADQPYRVEYSRSESIVAHFECCNYVEAENICVRQAPILESRFWRLLTSWEEKHSVNRAKSILYDILDTVENDRQFIGDDEVFARCVSYMQTHFSEADLDIERVCEYGFISLSGLQRKFQKHFSLSPKQYLTKLRMTRAKELLIARELTVRQVAFACGFSDEKYFSRVFRRQYGYPPSQMQRYLHM